MTVSRPVVAIIGAGMGGLATAIALGQVGVEAHVYEKARALRPVGAGLTLYPNGLRALDSIRPGLAHKIIDAGSALETIRFQKPSGESLLVKSVDLHARYGWPMLNITWAKLQALLVQRLPETTLHLNHACVDIVQQQNGALIRFANGQQVSADVVIAADGIHSKTRQSLFAHSALQATGRLSWRFLSTLQHPLLTGQSARLIVAPNEGKTLLLADMGNGTTFFSASMRYPDAQTADCKAHLQQQFGAWASPVPELIDSADAIIERPLFDICTLPRWVIGRVALLGDAAHAMLPSLGQGANTAFEDAQTVAHSLAHSPSIAQALAAYQAQRQTRTQIIQARSAYVSGRSYEHNAQQTIRDAWQKASIPTQQFEDWLYGGLLAMQRLDGQLGMQPNKCVTAQTRV